MALRKIFLKKKYNKKNASIILFFLITFTTCAYLFLFYQNNNYIVVPADNNKFYFTPKDKGGEIVKYLDKKSLNLKSEQEFEETPNQIEETYFSIQFYSDTDFKKVGEYLKRLNNENESIYILKDFFIISLNSEIGTDYFLLYKSFETKELAKNYCVNYLSKLDKCLIVDTTKF